MADEDLMGLTEIAALLDVSPQRVDQLARDYTDFPEPAAQLARGRVWRRDDITAWIDAHPERPSGRRLLWAGLLEIRVESVRLNAPARVWVVTLDLVQARSGRRHTFRRNFDDATAHALEVDLRKAGASDRSAQRHMKRTLAQAAALSLAERIEHANDVERVAADDGVPITYPRLRKLAGADDLPALDIPDEIVLTTQIRRKGQ